MNSKNTTIKQLEYTVACRNGDIELLRALREHDRKKYNSLKEELKTVKKERNRLLKALRSITNSVPKDYE